MFVPCLIFSTPCFTFLSQRFGILSALDRKGLNIISLHLSPLHQSRSSPTAKDGNKSDKEGLSTYLPRLLRRTILNVGLALRDTQFRDLADLHMRRHVEQYLHLLVRNDYLAPMLLLLRSTTISILLWCLLIIECLSYLRNKLIPI